jgi:spermidine synthase/MFS family permease
MTDVKPNAVRNAFGLGLLVFAVGACLMCIEVVGGMAIAPYFGSNVFVWGSVIVVFMAALSLGYLLGGRIGDTNPSPALLCMLAGVAGVLTAAVPLLAPVVGRAMLALDLGRPLNRVLPLAAAFALYFVPSVLIGMCLPIAVRIASTGLKSVGRVVGKIYALNALGSVAGALIGTLVLEPLVPKPIIFWCSAATLLATAAIAFALMRGLRPAVPPRSDEATDKATPVAGLRPLVFICGMVFMSLELLGGALIAPYFGSNVFVWGGVITVFLAALSVGYRAGGWLADRRPQMMILSNILVAAGILTIVIPLIAPAVCSAFYAASFGPTLNIIRPLIVCFVLFFIPTALFAMVAPFAVRLSTEEVGEVGGVAGRLYALSTLGNMVGILLTTFVLISLIGKTWLLVGAGALSVAVAVYAVIANNRARGETRQPVLVSALLLIAVVALALVPKPQIIPLLREYETGVGTYEDNGVVWHVVAQKNDAGHILLRRVAAEQESPYHHIAVMEERKLPIGKSIKTREGRRILVESSVASNRRELRFDQYVESSVLLDDDAKEIRKPYTSGTTYSNMLHLPLVFAPDAKDLMIVGGGGGVVPMIFKQAYPKVNVDVVEIDPVVADVAQKWFGMTLDDRLRLHVQDGRMFIHNSKKKYDAILLDAYTAGGRIPFHLTTREFLTEVRDHVRPGGVVLMNVISAVEGPASKLFRAEYKTFKNVFGAERVYVFPKVSREEQLQGWDREQSRNIMLVATGPAELRRWTPDDVVRVSERMLATKQLRMDTIPLYARMMLTRGKLRNIRQDDVPILTDDYAPVDMMIVDLD